MHAWVLWPCMLLTKRPFMRAHAVVGWGTESVNGSDVEYW